MAHTFYWHQCIREMTYPRIAEIPVAGISTVWLLRIKVNGKLSNIGTVRINGESQMVPLRDMKVSSSFSYYYIRLTSGIASQRWCHRRNIVSLTSCSGTLCAVSWPPPGFEPRTPGLHVQSVDHYTTQPYAPKHCTRLMYKHFVLPKVDF